MSDLQRYQWRSTSPMSHGIFKSDVGTYVKYEDARKRIEELEAALKVEVTKNTIDSVVHGELQRKLAASQGEVSFKDTRIEELEAEVQCGIDAIGNLVLERDELQSRIEAVRKLADELNDSAEQGYSMTSTKTVAEKLREALGGK